MHIEDPFWNSGQKTNELIKQFIKSNGELLNYNIF